MKTIKKEIKVNGLAVKNCLFFVKFSVGGYSMRSDPFRIVSSYSQLPKDEQLKRSPSNARCL